MKKIVEMKYGSHLYGTDTESSDLDLKGVYIPSPEEIILHSYKETIEFKRPKKPGERNTKDDVDLTYLSLDRFVELLAEGQTMALDMIFAPNYDLHQGQTWEILRENKDKLITKNVSAFVGYARQQAARYGVKGSRLDALKQTIEALSVIPDHDRLEDHMGMINTLVMHATPLVSLEKTALVQIVFLKAPNGKHEPYLEVCGRKIALSNKAKMAKTVFGKIHDEYGQRAHKAHLNGGKDFKALSHAVRVNSEALELLNTGHITFPRPDRELLLKIKKVEMPYEQIAEMIEQGLADLYEAQAKSTLRETPDTEWAKDFILETYLNQIKENT